MTPPRRAPYATLPMLAVVKPSGPYTASRFDAHYDTLATNLGEKLLPIVSANAGVVGFVGADVAPLNTAGKTFEIF